MADEMQWDLRRVASVRNYHGDAVLLVDCLVYAFRIHPVEQILLSEEVQDFAQIISFAVPVNFQVNLVPPRPHFHGLSDDCHAGADFDLVKKPGNVLRI